MDGAVGESLGRVLRVAAVLALAAVGAASRAADAPPARDGGLVPTPRKTRDELVREWDLNSDGKIDQGEVEIAASRMRRERAELRLNSGIDPVTGLPRGQTLEGLEPGDADAAAEPAFPEEEPAEEPDHDERPALPGTRVPRPTLPGPGRQPATPQAEAPQAEGPRTGGTRAAADATRRPLTGGVRAGGLPARAGYGAGVPATPLNAGLPIAPQARPTTRRATQARGGLVPAPRAPAPAPAATPPRPRDMYDPY